MSDSSPDQDETANVTRLLNASHEGEEGAREALIDLVYSQLHRIAQRRMSTERSDHSLQVTELVHEAYLKMAGSLDDHEWRGRAQFYAAAVQAMRRILINYARDRGRKKRGGEFQRVVMNVLDIAQAEDSDQILALNESIERLTTEDARLGKVVSLRFFAGLSVEETAKTLQISKRTVIRDWNFARAWLARDLQQDGSG